MENVTPKGSRSGERPRSARPWAAALAALGILCQGCNEANRPEDAPQPIVQEKSQGPVRVVVKADPGVVELTRDVLLSVTVEAPSEIDVALPQLEDRLQGFTLSGSYDRELPAHQGRRTRVRHARLTPVIAREYRVAPIPFSYTDRSVSPPRSGWFPSDPIVFEVGPAIDGPVPGRAQGKIEPVWVYPPFRTVALYIAIALLVCLAAYIAWRLLRRVHREIQVRRMSPRERALRELSDLLAKDLVKRNKVKDFYVELTMVVRRYIERAHGVRAPEQTTEEFLSAASSNRDFREDVLLRLQRFLNAADLVKFAADIPTDERIDNAVSTARQYVETDSSADAPKTESTVPMGT